MDEHKRKSDDVVDRLEGKIDKIYEFLIGDGSQASPGLLTRVDRIEQLEESRKMHRGVIYTSLMGLAAERVWHWFTGR
jgi:hypothetical protein